jgi:hypothetical protein
VSGTAIRVGDDPLIRIRLAALKDSLSVTLPADARVNGTAAQSDLLLFQDKDACVAAVGSARIASGTVRLTAPAGSLFTVALSQTTTARYPGTIECRVVDGQLAFIDELPLETYLAGLSER